MNNDTHGISVVMSWNIQQEPLFPLQKDCFE